MVHATQTRSALPVNVADLKAVLPVLSRIIRSRVTLPILEMVKVEICPARQTLALTATDLNLSVRVEVPGLFEIEEREESEAFLVQMTDLQRVVKTASHPQAGIDLRSLCVDEDVRDFPEDADLKEATTIHLEAKEIESLFQAFTCTCEDQTRYVLCGVCLDPSDGGKIVAADGRQLVCFDAPGVRFDPGSSRSTGSLERSRPLGREPDSGPPGLPSFPGKHRSGHPAQAADVLRRAKAGGKTVILLGCRAKIPPELPREITVVEFALPTINELDPVLQGILGSAGIQPLSAADQNAVLEAAGGLTTVEAENAFALSVIEKGNVSAEVVAREKAHTLKQGGLLEVIDVPVGLDDIGGLEALKAWLQQRREAFLPRAREYGLPIPKGLLILGVPGTGKSLTAKATARVFGSLLSWLQEKTTPVFVVATAHDISQLPPELLRKGRWDELWFVDLPNQRERTAIWDIVIEKYGRERTSFDTVVLARGSELHTGAEIESAFVEALHRAFCDQQREPTELDLGEVLTEMVPLATTMSESIERLRHRAKGRARHATFADRPSNGRRKLDLS